VSNTGSGTVSSFAIARDGSLALLDATAGTPGGESIDSALDRNSRHLYQLDASGDKVDAWTVERDGSLTPIGSFAGLPATAVGLAAN
jgi:6-phosphogluconolactonase (cycloisomerase 2 family)